MHPVPPDPTAGRLRPADARDPAEHVVPGDVHLARRLAIGGLAGVLVSTVMIGWMHVAMPGRELDPMSRTISEYALLDSGWVFDVGVLVLAAASAMVLVAMILRELVPARSVASVATAVWCIGLIGLIVFPKQGFGPDTTLAGRIHWTWTLIAFFSLPIGLLLACRRRTRGPHGRWPRVALALAWVSAGWFGVLALQTLLSALTPRAWNLVGFVERALAVTEMVAVVVLACWVLASCRPARLPAD
ncbi:DUF998 domain-containing protein [Nakamurella sp. YIM 132087]|uniref:DUF998 domain-containing protein n=1 Tax=Nakamurella alba TaxID=2665158 RepID=A0A7K1FKP4_9ACTN|nr:DUF998 domain-containing protein [Nakamurella alba]MTD13969.1 DUF998 domain-containing protein [Nakamurella alba]